MNYLKQFSQSLQPPSIECKFYNNEYKFNILDVCFLLFLCLCVNPLLQYALHHIVLTFRINKRNLIFNWKRILALTDLLLLNLNILQVRARRKVAVTVLAFVVIFGICFLPYHVFFLWFYYW